MKIYEFNELLINFSDFFPKIATENNVKVKNHSATENLIFRLKNPTTQSRQHLRYVKLFYQTFGKTFQLDAGSLLFKLSFIPFQTFHFGSLTNSPEKCW